MSIKESKSLTNIISTIIITGVYALIVYQRYLNGIADVSDVFRFWSITILLFIPISIVARIIILIVFNIISAVVLTAKGEDVEDEVIDERDKLIELKVTRISLVIFSLGFILSLATQLFNVSNHVFFITLILSGVVSEIVSDITSITYYRKGM